MATVDCYIKSKFYEDAYKLGARWNPETCKWTIDVSNPKLKKLTRPTKPNNVFMKYDLPELHLDDRRKPELILENVDVLESEKKAIENIFLSYGKEHSYTANDTIMKFTYFRANRKCELCNTFINSHYNIYVVYEDRCKLYRCVCKECYNLVTINLNFPIEPIYFNRFLELSGWTREELEKKLVDIINKNE